MSPNISAVGATLQFVGVVLLGVLFTLTSRTLGARYLRHWARAWWALALSLGALQASFWIDRPAAAHALQPVYHAGELIFLLLLVSGLRARAEAAGAAAGRHGPPLGPGWPWYTGAGLLGLGLPWLHAEFTYRFLVQAALVAAGFVWAFATLWRTRGHGEALGVRVTLAALAMLALDFALYPIVFGIPLGGAAGPPVLYASFTSFYDLLFEVLLGFGLLVIGLQDTTAQLRTLQRLLPICAWCRKLRDDQGYWSDLETWARANVRADVTHGICPECRAVHFPEAGATPP